MQLPLQLQLLHPRYLYFLHPSAATVHTKNPWLALLFHFTQDQLPCDTATDVMLLCCCSADMMHLLENALLDCSCLQGIHVVCSIPDLWCAGQCNSKCNGAFSSLESRGLCTSSCPSCWPSGMMFLFQDMTPLSALSTFPKQRVFAFYCDLPCRLGSPCQQIRYAPRHYIYCALIHAKLQLLFTFLAC